MGQTTEILWADHTFNPWWGCHKISEGCAHCYADTFSKRVGFKIWGQDADRRMFTDDHFKDPIKWNKAAEKAGVMRSVFCGSMCDIFEDRMDLDTPRMRVFRMVPETPNLLWLFLTKRPEKALQLLPSAWVGNWPRNVKVGVTIENQARLDERMEVVRSLHRRFPGISVFASCEPLLSPLDWQEPEWRKMGPNVNPNGYLQYLDWVVAGGESGPGARPCHPDWARKLRDDCANRDDMCRPWPLPFLWKQWGDLIPVEWHGRGQWVGQNGISYSVGPDPKHFELPDGHHINAFRVGKVSAGRLIDGKEHAQFPRLTYGVQLAALTAKESTLNAK
jgi:protein gp37